MTIGQTTTPVGVLLEHAVRRCGLLPSTQTPETVKIAQESLFYLLVHLSSRGINLWCVDQQIIPLVAGQRTYVLPPGTIDVLNANYSMPTYVSGALTTDATSATLSFSSSPALRVGFTPSVGGTTSIALSTSTDGVTFTAVKTLESATYIAGQQILVDIDGAPAVVAVKVSAPAAFSFSSVVVASATYEQTVQQISRDDWTALPNKSQSGRPSTNFYYEKLVAPQVTLWPVPNNSTDHLVVWRHRQVKDITTSLQASLDIPARWLEPIIWQLAVRLAVELPQVDPARRQEVIQLAERYLIEGEWNETDHGPVFLTPRISAYTR